MISNTIKYNVSFIPFPFLISLVIKLRVNPCVNLITWWLEIFYTASLLSQINITSQRARMSTNTKNLNCCPDSEIPRGHKMGRSIQKTG